MAELKLAIQVRLRTECALNKITFENLAAPNLNTGRLKLVQIYFERLVREQKGQ